ncbi:MAG: ribulose-phosphate 3-epimerase [Deltaproteobacteria bacterium CG11_big_fil_rev_8_21_14_0_20_49_13]|nr:MAG: ribulose-phosphate 3-epimerase [Deltaproteobacteria bacterium CG11_big_fil_rev_8_21_14_0_20_49_13]
MRLIAPSILSADFGRLAEEVKAVEEAGADIIHVDVMDGHFVPNITIGPDVVKAVRKATAIPLDVHLMIEHPEKYIEKFAEAGADMLSVHFEACDLEKILTAIRKLKCKAGAVINPPSDVEKFLPFVEYADFVLVMTVNPGFGGQSLIHSCLEKIRRLHKHIYEDKKWNKLIEVDGGIKVSNVKEVTSAGGQIIVAGSAIFGKKDYKKAIEELKA